MKIERGLAKQGRWIFNDGSQPVQVRVMGADEVRAVKHLHRTMFEYFYLLRGRMTLAVKDRVVEMEKDDLVVVEPGEPHQVVDLSEDLMLMLLMPPPIAEDKVLLE